MRISPSQYCTLLVFSLFIVVSGAFAEPIQNKLTIERYLDWEDVSNPQISPNGSQIVYERRWVDAINDKWETAIWSVNADGTKHRFLAYGTYPKWSPDGTRIAYFSEGDQNNRQIFVRWMDEGAGVSQVTRVRETPSSLTWSPDSAFIAFQMIVAIEEEDVWDIDMPEEPADADWTDSPKIIERLHYRRDRIGYFQDGFRQFFLVQADGGVPRQVTNGNWHHDNLRWMPDGRSLVFNALRVEDAEYQWRESEVYSVSIENGEVTQLSKRRGPDHDPVPSPDGSLIAYVGYDWTDDTYVEEGIYVMESDGSMPRKIAAEMGRRPINLIWARNSSGVYFTAETRGTSNLFYAPLDGAPSAITKGQQMLNVTGLASDRAVGTLASYQTPKNLVVFQLSEPGEFRTLHESNRDVLEEVELGEVEEIWYDSIDNFKIHGWIVKPPGFDPSKKYPLILRIHGGPHSMYNVAFDFKNHNHAANGYVVLYTNPRGSAGYGSAFGNAIKNAYPDKDYDDLMAGVDVMISRGYIDERNLFVYGGSGGGVLTAWIVGHTDRFTAAVSKAPVINWLSFVGTTDGSSWYRNFSKLPWQDPKEHLRRSPLMYVGSVKTPTLLMTGEKDLRTPMEQTEQFYSALKLRKVPTAMIRLTDGWHSRSLPPTNLMRVQLYLRNWFERFMVKN